MARSEQHSYDSSVDCRVRNLSLGALLAVVVTCTTTPKTPGVDTTDTVLIPETVDSVDTPDGSKSDIPPLDSVDTVDVDIEIVDTPIVDTDVPTDVVPAEVVDTPMNDTIDATVDGAETTSETTEPNDVIVPVDSTTPPDATDTAAPLDVEPDVEECAALNGITSINPVPMILGAAGPGGSFLALAPGDPIEIVQGPQGGVHLEVAFQVALPETFTKTSAKMTVNAHSYQPCCMGNMVGSYVNNKYLAFKTEANSQTFASGVIPVIFFQNEAIHYQDEECCVVLSLEVYGTGSTEIAATSSAIQSFTCVDYF